MENRQVARQLRITDQTVYKWRERFRTARLEGLADEPRPGAPRTVKDAQVEARITRTLDTRPLLPLRPGVPARQIHDYTRNGTTSLFAAFDVTTGKVIGAYHRRHRHQEFLRFLERIEDRVPSDLDIHLVMDNYGTHKMSKVKRWFARHPRYHVHFTPTSASWLNQIERFFGLLTDRRIRRGTFANVRELESAIRDHLAHHNRDPKPFTWTADADSILEKVARFCLRTSDSGH